MDECDGMCRGVFSIIDMIVVNKYVKVLIDEFESSTVWTHEKKLSNLGINNHISPCDPNDVVFNYSSNNLSTRIKTLLAYGLDFCLPAYKLHFYKFFLPLESLVTRVII